MYLAVLIYPAAKSGFAWRPVFDFKAKSLKKIIFLMIPRTFGIAANQINQIIAVSVASLLQPGSIAVFNFANNLYGVPVGIFGISYANAAFGQFSKDRAGSNFTAVAEKFSTALRQVAFIVVPASFLIFFLRDNLVSLIYRHGAFTNESAVLTSASLGIFCLGIYFASAMPLFFRLFFAFCDTLTPTISTLASVAANIAMNFYFVALLAGFSAPGGPLGGAGDISVLGLAIAFTLANILQFLVLAVAIRVKLPKTVKSGEVAFSFAKVFLASLTMFVALYFINANILFAARLGEFWFAASISVIAVIIFLLSAMIFRCPELNEFVKLLKNGK
jgi:putative peptidoglycan lipid II flippase